MHVLDLSTPRAASHLHHIPSDVICTAQYILSSWQAIVIGPQYEPSALATSPILPWSSELRCLISSKKPCSNSDGDAQSSSLLEARNGDNGYVKFAGLTPWQRFTQKSLTNVKRSRTTLIPYINDCRASSHCIKLPEQHLSIGHYDAITAHCPARSCSLLFSSSLCFIHTSTSMQLSNLLLLVILLALRAWAQSGPTSWTASPFNPPALPLAVRSPYLNVWLTQGNDPPSPFDLDAVHPWAMNSPVGWYANAVVDDTEHRLLGQYTDNNNVPNQTAVEFTATRTSFLLSAGPVQFNMSFLSPVEPNNFTLQSLPFSYLYITAQSTDGQLHRVRMYSDIAGDLIAGDLSQIVEWSSEDTSDYVVLSMHLQNQVPFVESNIHPQDATLINAFKKIGSGTTSWAISNIDSTRGVLVNNPSGGNLSNQADPPSDFGPASSGDGGKNSPVLGISIDWGNISSTPEPAVWAFGVYRNPTIQRLTPEGSFENRSPYFASEISDPVTAAKVVLDDFPRASSAAQALDTQIRADGETFSTEYADLLALSARQAMGSMDITIPPSSGGTWDTSDVKIFMKNLGSVGSDNGTLASVNNVDALYAAFPAFLYLNPEIGRCLLEPLLEFQDSPAYKLPYAARNIGSTYPFATAGDINTPHIYGVDESANMIIMILAYSLASGNGTLIQRHYNLMRNWAIYLSGNAITPFNQSSGDFSANTDFTSPNQTDLALKGIIGIAAMARVAELAGLVSDQQNLSATASSALQLWQDQAVSASHVNFFYGNSSSSGMMYDLYADRLLRLNLVPDSVYTLLTGFYQNEAGSLKYGIPLSNSPGQNTTTNSMMFTAATANSNATRDLLVSQIHAYASNNLNSVPFTSMYDPVSGLGGPGTSTGIASPAQGGIFALLALNTTSKSVSVPFIEQSSNGSSGSSKPKAGLIAGLVVACVAIVAFLSLGLYFFWRKRRARRNANRSPTTSKIEPAGFVQPFPLSPTSPDDTSFHDTEFQREEGTRTYEKFQSTILDTTGPCTQSSTVPSSQAAATERSPVVEALRSEFNSLRQTVERIVQERRAADEPPPIYSDSAVSWHS
ncbi:DUF1793-domain-containing protein [Fomitiporia mediterranea MF3/22]|uniref:DUF1793-domain-containing protein n=1 Tax=Fomitiporia mediterranea (strain MF3/22) TaxID=694068 RepID=UPI0004407A2D|nr:DUF1793-domain-containing protein [Fomitiporia mediterranea MF3/22]EJC98554.1 DUF1793-domain-containing protein [Fomitiporia mediterranea MF3/22]